MRSFIIVIALMISIGCATEQPKTSPVREAMGAPTHLGQVSIKEVATPTLVTRSAPDFTADAVMPDGSFKELTLSEYKGKYVVLFFYPLDFTVVCPTEIVAFNDRLEDFNKNNCEVLAVSTDSKYTHFAWRNTPLEKGGIGAIGYPMVSDITKEIAKSYGVLQGSSVALRGLFIIDPKGVIRHALINDTPLGRNVDEAYRTLMALRMLDAYGEFCPANWQPGDKTIKTAKEYMEDYLKRKK